MTMKKLLSILLFLALFTLSINGPFTPGFYTAAEEEPDFSVYCSTATLSNSAKINGNMGIASSGSLDMRNNTEITGKLYKGNNVDVSLDGPASIGDSQISIGTEPVYNSFSFAGLPDSDAATLPSRGNIDNYNGSLTIVQDGYYPSITLNTLTVDVTHENRFLRIDSMNIKKIVLNGSNKLFLFVDSLGSNFTWQGELNKNGQTGQVHMYVHRQSNLTLGQVDFKASIYAPNAGKIHLSNGSAISGNIVGKNVELSNNSDTISGFVYIPGYSLTMSNRSKIAGKVVASSVTMSNNSEIVNEDVSLDIPEEILNADKDVVSNDVTAKPIIQSVDTEVADGQNVFEVTHSLVDNAVSYDGFIDGVRIDFEAGQGSKGILIDRNILEDKGIIRFTTNLNIFDITVKPKFEDGSYGQISDEFSVNNVTFSVSNPVEANIVSNGVFLPDEEIPYMITIKNCKDLRNVTLRLDLNVGEQKEKVKYVPWTYQGQNYIQLDENDTYEDVSIQYLDSADSGDGTTDIHLQLKLNDGNTLDKNEYNIKFKLKMQNNNAMEREPISVQNNIMLKYIGRNSMTMVTNESYIKVYPFAPILQ